MRKILKIFYLAIPMIVLLVLGVLITKPQRFLSEAFGVNAKLFIDAGSSFDVGGQSWKNLGQGGEETGVRMLSSVIPQVKALGPRYIRIDHIYDYYDVFSRDGSGNLVFNFNQLDATVDDILATGAKPFFSLSYMPPAMGNGDITGLPNDWRDWELLVQRTIEHYSGEKGISNVYYEVWNEPDLFGDFKTYGGKNYLDLYFHSSVGASRAKNVLPYKFGGPATTAPYRAWLNNFVDFVSKNNLRLDFYSWHRYSLYLEDYEKDYKRVSRWLRKYPKFKDVELVISELGHDSENSPGYDNNFSAIHTLAVTSMLESNVSKLMHFEIKDGPGPEKYWGRWGILSHEKYGAPATKPRYLALAFLNKMSGNKVNSAGEGTWVKAFAKKEGNIIKLMVVNYDQGGKHFEAVPITFVNLPTNTFTFRRTNFLGDTTERVVQTTNFRWETKEGFDPNSAAIFEIIPL